VPAKLLAALKAARAATRRKTQTLQSPRQRTCHQNRGPKEIPSAKGWDGNQPLKKKDAL